MTDDLVKGKDNTLRHRLRILAQQATNAIGTGLDSQDVLRGVPLTHDDVIALSCLVDEQAARIEGLAAVLRRALSESTSGPSDLWVPQARAVLTKLDKESAQCNSG